MKQPGSFARIVCVLLAGALGCGASLGFGVQDSSAPAESRAKSVSRDGRDFTIRVGVDEVRLDAVVLDWKGRQITDLRAEDFEVYQDGKRQEVLSSEYIVDHRATPALVGKREAAAGISPLPLTKEGVRRTFVFLVDDLSMGPQAVHHARMCLDRFIDRQMQPGDLVAIMQTKGGSAGLMAFTSERRALKARASSVRWTGEILSSNGIAVSTGVPCFMALPYVIRVLNEMPGRKYIMVLSNHLYAGAGAGVLDMLADQAMRAGVVIHTLDVLGVVDYPSTYALGIDSKGFVQMNETAQTYGSRFESLKIGLAQQRAKSRPISLAEKTGGVHLSNNFFVSGIGAVDEDLKGYYLLSYTPPESTFEAEGPNAYHRVKIRVKRTGAEVHTRDGFYGSAPKSAEPPKGTDQLSQALNSPFESRELDIGLESGYLDDRPNGYLLRAWFQLDGERVGIAEGKDGRRSIELDVAAAVSDVQGLVHDSGRAKIAAPVNNADVKWIRKNRLKFSLALMVDRPGAHFVRIAVKDSVSGAIGSAYRFVEIPDLSRNRLALSSIFVLGRDEADPWSGRSEQSSSKQVARRSDASRSYRAPDSFDYAAVIYNAPSKKGARPDLEQHFILFRDGVEVFRSQPSPVDLAGATDFSKIPVRRTFQVDTAMGPGDYVVQFVVTDRRKKERMAVQSLDFRVEPAENAR